MTTHDEAKEFARSAPQWARKRTGAMHLPQEEQTVRKLNSLKVSRPTRVIVIYHNTCRTPGIIDKANLSMIILPNFTCD